MFVVVVRAKTRKKEHIISKTLGRVVLLACVCASSLFYKFLCTFYLESRRASPSSQHTVYHFLKWRDHYGQCLLSSSTWVEKWCIFCSKDSRPRKFKTTRPPKSCKMSFEPCIVHYSSQNYSNHRKCILQHQQSKFLKSWLILQS
jgi:hypothetical protein